MCLTERPKTISGPLEDTEGDDERCVTPPHTTEDSEREDDMEEIPHMLSPGSDVESDEEVDFHHNHRLGMSGTPILYTQRAGSSSYLSTPEINAGSASDVMEGSPVSSITNYTPRPQDFLVVDSSHASSKILHPPSISSSEDSSRNKGKSTISTNSSGKPVQNRKKRSKSKRKKGSSSGSFAAGVTVPHMDNHSSTSSSYPLHISPRVALQPRMGNPKHLPSISPVTKHPFSTPSSSSTTSKVSLSSLVRPNLSGRSQSDSPRQMSDPTGRPYPHRRSISLDIPSAQATSRKMRIWDHKRLSTLREGTQATMPIIPINYVPASATSPYPSPHQKHHHRRKASKCSSSPMAPSQHRRTVSFPDDVLQKNKFGVNHAHYHQHDEGALQHYNDYTLESDDPALFSLVETSLSRSNGRVYIATDVDPKFTSPFYTNGKGYSSSSALALTQRYEIGHSASSVGSHRYSCSTTSTLTSPSVGDKKLVYHADDGMRGLHIQSQQQTQTHSQKVSRKSKKSSIAKQRAALGRKHEQALPSRHTISASGRNADTDTSIGTVKTGNRTKRHKRNKKKSRLAMRKGSAMGSDKAPSPSISTSSSRFGIDQHSSDGGPISVKSQEASHCIIQ
uniref:Uncharacterized protein n=1 Tax=Chaetoceros debilis TaxID=122233 RepID=A0A7S3VCG1_9STRA|mmetsp:Transcript_28927/g.44200  ORF Transcript_28927/g.44200 Transcript_28927/m.44200 type:complete len:620 (+) Transcript_28927:884-2743(+)|eukprot:CAMPEP_0194093404 /NCGR_PEP_ID=MMETSP0149-20130528/50295_1 /TAXON_ID=122233 /ORGANISM="Chaetoceros debilis, Strain MM31A-1" /LENGTH=619 /DNA_ID=CAMNT_0038778701 /DNA_START=857 /DNA_END=2716 /DNA_ORIENTATION=+